MLRPRRGASRSHPQDGTNPTRRGRPWGVGQVRWGAEGLPCARYLRALWYVLFLSLLGTRVAPSPLLFAMLPAD